MHREGYTLFWGVKFLNFSLCIKKMHVACANSAGQSKFLEQSFLHYCRYFFCLHPDFNVYDCIIPILLKILQKRKFTYENGINYLIVCLVRKI